MKDPISGSIELCRLDSPESLDFLGIEHKRFGQGPQVSGSCLLPHADGRFKPGFAGSHELDFIKSEAGTKKSTGPLASVPKHPLAFAREIAAGSRRLIHPSGGSDSMDSIRNPQCVSGHGQFWVQKRISLYEVARLIYRRQSSSIDRTKGRRCRWERNRYPAAHLADPSTYQVEFAGVRTGWLFPSTRIVAARDIRLDEQSGFF
jgi:hypothetical protein